MAKNDFIKQLGEIKKNFLKHAKENSHKIKLNTFKIDICNYYLLMYIECEDKYGDCITFEQQVDIGDNEELEQNPLFPSSIHKYTL